MAISKYLLFSVLIFLLGFLLASYRPTDNGSSPPPPAKPPPGFDYFKLALQWPNAFCRIAACRPPVPKQQYFTIHGLWPQKNYGGQPRDCAAVGDMTDDILVKFKNDLLDYWPRLFTADDFNRSKKLWKEQWEHHGSCSSNKFLPEAYLRITIDLGKKYGQLILEKMEEQGIKPDGSTLQSAQKTLDAIKAATNTAAIITCTEDKSGTLQLDDIRLCVQADGQTLQDCTSSIPQGKCSKGFIFPSPPTDTHSPFPIFEDSIRDVEGAVGI